MVISQGAQIMQEVGDGWRDAGARSKIRTAVMGTPLSRLCCGGWLGYLLLGLSRSSKGRECRVGGGVDRQESRVGGRLDPDRVM